MANQFLDILKKTGSNLVKNATSFGIPSLAPINKKLKEVIPDNSNTGIAINTVREIPNATKNVFKDILQTTARSAATVGVTAGNVPTQIANKITGQKSPLPFNRETETTGNKFTEALYGGKPIRTIPSVIENTEKMIEPYVGEKNSKFYGLPLAIGGLAMDLSGFGGKAVVKSFSDEIPEAFLKYMAKEKNPQIIEETLKKVGLDSANSKILSSKLAPTGDIDSVKNVLASYSQSKPPEPNLFKNILKSPETAPREVVPVKTPDSTPTSPIVAGTPSPVVNQAPNLLDEAKKYKTAEEFFLNSRSGKELLREKGIKSQEAIKNWFNENATPAQDILDNLNPTGGVYVDYTPQKRAIIPLGKNITTLDKTLNKTPDETITIYRGVPKNQKEIVPGDFITTNPDLAKSYGVNVISKKVKLSDVLDDITEPLGDEYIYRPKEPETPKFPKVQAVEDSLARAKAGEDFGPRNQYKTEPIAVEKYKSTVSREPISEILTQGNTRIVRRGNTEIYQYKDRSGDRWLTAKDPETAKALALKESLPPAKIRSEQDIKKMTENEVMRENLKEILADHPAKPLLKFIDKKEGEFLDFMNPDLAKTPYQRNKIIAKNKKIMRTAENAFQDRPELSDRFDNQDTIKEVIQDYLDKRNQLKNLGQEGKALAKVKTGDKPVYKSERKKNPELYTFKDSIDTKINNAEDAKKAFEAYERGDDPLLDDVNLPIQNTVFDEITDSAKVDNFVFKPIKPFIGYARDPLRNFESFFGREYPTIKEKFLDPLDKSKGDYIDTEVKLADELYTEIVEKLGIKKGSKEDAAVMDYGERNLTGDFAAPYTKANGPRDEYKLVSEFGKEKADKIIKADAFFQKKYEELIDAMNAERKKIYGPVWEKKKNLDSEIALLQDQIGKKKFEMESKNRTDTLAYQKLENQLRRLREAVFTRQQLMESEVWWRGKIIPKRKDYYRHYQELAEGFKALKNIITSDANISSVLAGLTNMTKPKTKFLQVALKRIGNLSERSAVGGFLNYIPSASYAIHIDPHIEGFRKMAEALRKSDNNAYSPFIEFLTDFANDLAGKTNEIDRGVQKVTGRQVFNILNWTNNRVKANTILGNVSSSLAQIFNVPAGVASAKYHSIEGAARTFAGIYENNIPMQKSTFIKERFKGDIRDKFNTSMLDNTKKFAVWMLSALDEVGTKFIWNSHYAKAVDLLKKSSDGQFKLNNTVYTNPVRYADDVTRKLVGGRGIGEVPLVQKSKLFQVAAPFQLEVGNAWWVMKDFVSAKDFGAIALLFVTTFLMNRVAEDVRGSDVAFDPIQAIIEGSEAFRKEENKGMGALKAGGRVVGEALSNIPGGQTIAAMYPEKGNALGFGLSRKELFGKGDPTRFGGNLLVMKGIQDPLFKLAFPFAGGQIKKTYEGIETQLQGGSFTSDGDLQFEADKSITGILKSVFFGKYAQSGAQDYFDSKEPKAKEFKKIKPTYEKVQELKKTNEEEAIALYDALSTEDKAMYQAYKKTLTAEKNIEGKKKILPKFQEIRKVKNSGKVDEAIAMYDALSEEDKGYYQLLKKQADKITDAEEGVKPEYTNGEGDSENSIIKTVTTYAKAVGTDPITAFNRIFTGQHIRRVDNGAIIVNRLSLPKSEKIKKERGSKGDMKLDHTIPLQLGGSNNDGNLKLVTNEEWESYTPVENYLGKKLKEKKFTKKEVQELIKDFKNGKITAEEIYAK